jgi:hypothetical protein
LVGTSRSKIETVARTGKIMDILGRSKRLIKIADHLISIEFLGKSGG